jgi:hypothetical protein
LVGSFRIGKVKGVGMIRPILTSPIIKAEIYSLPGRSDEWLKRTVRL